MASASASDVTLARFAEAAFSDAPALPAGFAPVRVEDLGLAIDPGESFAGGLYKKGTGAAIVATGPLDGLPTLVLAFRGADDRQDSINVLTNPNAAYPDFAELVAAVDAYAARGEFGQVALTGHSLGGSLVQVFMAEHPPAPDGGGVRYVADTFGSPGALVPDGPDARISNYVVADDPAVFLGENRAGVGDALEGNPLLASPAAALAADVFPGLTEQDALAAIPSFTVNYENRGETVLLPGKTGGTDPISSVVGLVQADPGQHRIALYISEVGELAATPPNGAAPFPPGRPPETLFDRGFYLARNPDVAAAGADPQTHFDAFGWREARDPNALFDTDFYLMRNADVAAAGANPLLHYQLFGWREGRDPGPQFDTSRYLELNPDVAQAGVNPLEHYFQYGIAEHRLVA